MSLVPLLAQVSPEAVGLGVGLGFVLLIGLAIVASIALFVLWIWMLVDCAQSPHDPRNPNTRLIWILVLIFTGWLGALLYYFIVRRPRLALAATRGYTGNPFVSQPPPARRS